MRNKRGPSTTACGTPEVTLGSGTGSVDLSAWLSAWGDAISAVRYHSDICDTRYAHATGVDLCTVLAKNSCFEGCIVAYAKNHAYRDGNQSFG